MNACSNFRNDAKHEHLVFPFEIIHFSNTFLSHSTLLLRKSNIILPKNLSPGVANETVFFY